MTRPVHRSAIAVSAITGVLLIASSVAAQDPWARVPPSPTTCFADDDRFGDAVVTATKGIADETIPQKALRREMSTKLKALDPGTQASRMASFMAGNPAKAQQYMQAMAVGQQPLTELTARRTELDERFKTIERDYVAEIRKLDPIPAKVKTFGDGMTTHPTAVALIAEWNSKYQKICESRIQHGPFADWLRDYKQHLVDLVPKQIVIESFEKLHYEVFGVPTTGFKSIVELEAISHYIRKVDEVYARREHHLFTIRTGSSRE